MEKLELLKEIKKLDLLKFLYSETATILEQYGWSDFVRRVYNDYRILSNSLFFFGYFYCNIICLKSKKNNKVKIMFQSTKYIDIIEELIKTDKIEVLVWNFFKGNLSKYKLFKKFLAFPITYQSLTNTSNNLDNNINDIDKKLNTLVNKIAKDIEKIKHFLLQHSPNLIVLRTDSSPIDRALIIAAKELGIPTINLQDGIYVSKYPLIHGRAADYVFVWGKYFKNLYLKQKIRNSDTVKILGYPYRLNLLPQDNKAQKLTVYYLGQNFELYNKKLLELKVETIRILNKICKKYGFEFIYRPHPGDFRKLLQKKLSEVKFTPETETLKDSFKKGNIFISFNSTSLIEAALHGKLALQLKNYPVPTDDFEKLGIVSKSFNNIKELENYLKEIAKVRDIGQFYKSFNSEYIEIPKPSPAIKFLKLINEIILTKV